MILIKEFVLITGNMTLFFIDIIRSLRYSFQYRDEVFKYIYQITIDSVIVLIIGSVFIGMVSSYQIAYQMRNYIPMVYLSTLVTQSVILELGPLITGIAFSGKVSSSVAAELTSMKISDQMDALSVMGIEPIEYLIMPRMLASVMIIPFLTIWVEFMIILGAFIIAVFSLNIPVNVFIEGMHKNFNMFYIFGGLIKTLFFGLFTMFIPCYFAMNSGYGSKSVGINTTRSVIISVIGVIVLDYILTRMLFLW